MIKTHDNSKYILVFVTRRERRAIMIKSQVGHPWFIS